MRVFIQKCAEHRIDKDANMFVYDDARLVMDEQEQEAQAPECHALGVAGVMLF